MSNPLDLAAIEARCARFQGNTGLCPRCPVIASNGADVPALCAEVRRLQAELDNPVRTGVCVTCVEAEIKKNEELLADNERMRRGVAEIENLAGDTEVNEIKTCDLVGRYARNLLAGREWSDAEVE